MCLLGIDAFPTNWDQPWSKRKSTKLRNESQTCFFLPKYMMNHQLFCKYLQYVRMNRTSLPTDGHVTVHVSVWRVHLKAPPCWILCISTYRRLKRCQSCPWRNAVKCNLSICPCPFHVHFMSISCPFRSFSVFQMLCNALAMFQPFRWFSYAPAEPETGHERATVGNSGQQWATVGNSSSRVRSKNRS